MSRELQMVIGDYEAFIKNLDTGLADVGINSNELSMMDHICYRVKTEERYQEMTLALGQVGLSLGEAMISGRPIATFELHDYISVGRWTVPYIELPSPKPGSPYPEGLEHAEFVVIGGLDRFERAHAELPFNRGGMNKTINPELGLKTENISVKFHEQQLGAVVRIEDRLAAQ